MTSNIKGEVPFVKLQAGDKLVQVAPPPPPPPPPHGGNVSASNVAERLQRWTDDDGAHKPRPLLVTAYIKPTTIQHCQPLPISANQRPSRFLRSYNPSMIYSFNVTFCLVIDLVVWWKKNK